MEANAATHILKEPTNVEVIKEINIDIDPIMPMSTVAENYLQPTPQTTCVEPSRT
jgi:hypothetical protein